MCSSSTLTSATSLAPASYGEQSSTGEFCEAHGGTAGIAFAHRLFDEMTKRGTDEKVWRRCFLTRALVEPKKQAREYVSLRSSTRSTSNIAGDRDPPLLHRALRRELRPQAITTAPSVSIWPRPSAPSPPTRAASPRGFVAASSGETGGHNDCIFGRGVCFGGRLRCVRIQPTKKGHYMCSKQDESRIRRRCQQGGRAPVRIWLAFWQISGE